MVKLFNLIERIGIIGTGLIGASIGLSLKKTGFKGEIIGIDSNNKEMLLARSIGAIDECYDKIDKSISHLQLVIIAVPVSKFSDVLIKLSKYDHSELIITDVGSTKSTIIKLSEQILSDPGRFIGSHPMAGNELNGALGANSGIFNNKTCILVKNIKTCPSVFTTVSELWRSIGMNVVTMSGDEHDNCTAVTSHLPHILSVLLVNIARRLGDVQTASTGFIDVSRLASSNPEMRRDIMKDNSKHILDTLSILTEEINNLRNILTRSEDDRLLKLLCATKIFRDKFLSDKNHSIAKNVLHNTYTVNQ